MRVIHLCFQLHLPYELVWPVESGSGSSAMNEGRKEEDFSYFDSKEVFDKANREIYQPFFALLERNIQKYKALHLSLMVSGVWLEQAEKYDAELVERLKKLVKTGQVELVSVPYYYSLAFFYAKDELTEQVKKYQEQLERLFGAKGRVFAMPELIYNDAIGKWAEDFGFAGMLVGGSVRVLDWRSPNHVYEAEGCDYLRLLVRNSHLSELVERGDKNILVEKKVEGGDGKRVLSIEGFQKALDLDFLRGGLVNLYFDTQLFVWRREQGIIKFFDELIARWIDEENKFATATEGCMIETPTMELSVKETVSWRGDAEDVDKKNAERGESEGLVLKAAVENKLPKWLSRKEQVAVSELLYGVRRQVLASEDEKLIADLRRLMLVDYHKGVDSSIMAKLMAIVDDLKRRTEKIKKTQAVEISRTYTKKRDRGDVERRVEHAVQPKKDDVETVRVSFGKRSGVESGVVHVKMRKDDGLEVPVRRLGRVEEFDGYGREIEVDDEEMPAIRKLPVAQKRKKHAVRKIIKKLVIE